MRNSTLRARVAQDLGDAEMLDHNHVDLSGFVDAAFRARRHELAEVERIVFGRVTEPVVAGPTYGDVFAAGVAQREALKDGLLAPGMHEPLRVVSDFAPVVSGSGAEKSDSVPLSTSDVASTAESVARDSSDVLERVQRLAANSQTAGPEGRFAWTAYSAELPATSWLAFKAGLRAAAAWAALKSDGTW